MNDDDFEAMVLAKLQRAEEEKRKIEKIEENL